MSTTHGPLIRHWFRRSFLYKMNLRFLFLYIVAVVGLLLLIGHLTLFSGRGRRILFLSLLRRICDLCSDCLSVWPNRKECWKTACLRRMIPPILRLDALLPWATTLARVATRSRISRVDNDGSCSASVEHLKIFAGDEWLSERAHVLPAIFVLLLERCLLLANCWPVCRLCAIIALHILGPWISLTILLFILAFLIKQFFV